MVSKPDLSGKFKGSDNDKSDNPEFEFQLHNLPDM